MERNKAMKIITGGIGLAAAAVLTLSGPAATAAACGQDATPAVTKTVHHKGTPAVTRTVTDVEAAPAVPAVEEVSHTETVVDTPAVPAVEEVGHWTDVIPATPGTPAEYATEFYWVKITPAWTERSGWVLEKPEGAWIQYMERKVIDTPASPATPGTDAYDEQVIDHPAYDEQVLDQPAWTEVVEGEPGFWTNFQPNNYHEPFDGPPAYPSDPRGTWSTPKENGGPQQDASGVYQNGHGNGSWFYRSQGTVDQTIEHEATYRTVHHEATYTTVHHDAVPGTPAVEEVSHMEFKFKRAHRQINEYRWSFTTPGDGWVKQGQEREVMTKPATPGTPEIPAEWVIDIPGTPEIPAVTHEEEVIDTAYVPAIPAVEEVTHEETVVEAVPPFDDTRVIKEAVPATEKCVAPPATDKPQAKPTPDTNQVLPNTGGPEMLGLFGGLAALIAGAATLIHTRRRKN